TGIETENFITEESDVNGAKSLPQGSRFDGTKEQAPALGLEDVDGNVGDDRERDPPPVHFLEVRDQFREFEIAQRPDKETKRERGNRDQGDACACPGRILLTQVTMIPIYVEINSGVERNSRM